MRLTKKQLSSVAGDKKSNRLRWTMTIWCKFSSAFVKHDWDALTLVFSRWQHCLPTFLLAIPKGAIYAPNGASIDYLTMSCSNINHPEWNSGKWKSISIQPLKLSYPLYFQYSTVDTHETVWTSGTAVSENGDIAKPFDSSTINSIITSVSGGSTFTTQIDLLYFNLWREFWYWTKYAYSWR